MGKVMPLQELESLLPTLKTNVPDEVSNRIQERLRQSPAQASVHTLDILRRREPTWKRGTKRPLFLGAAGVAIVLLLTLPFTPAAQAIQQNMLTQTLLHWLRGTPAEPWVQKVNSPVTSNGVTLTITDVLYDRNTIQLSYTVVFSKPSTAQSGVNLDTEQLKFNGQKVKNMAMGSESPTKNGFNGMISIYPQMNLSASGTLQLVVTQIGQTHGRWAFKLPVSAAKLDASGTVYHPNTEGHFDGMTVTVNRISVTPAVTELDYQISGPKQDFIPIFFDMTGSDGHRMVSTAGGPTDKPKVINGIETEQFRATFQTQNTNNSKFILQPWSPSHSFKKGTEWVITTK